MLGGIISGDEDGRRNMEGPKDEVEDGSTETGGKVGVGDGIRHVEGPNDDDEEGVID